METSDKPVAHYHYVVLMVVSESKTDGTRDYLQPVKTPDGEIIWFTLEHANEWIERMVNDPSPAGLMGRQFYDTGVPVDVSDMTTEEVHDMIQRLWGVRPADLARLAEHWPEE